MASTRDKDGGWAWVILCACAMCVMMTSGLAMLAGMFQKVFLEEFSGGVFVISWITSIFSSLMQLSGPLTGLVCTLFSCRTSVMSGAVLLSAGLLLSAFCTHWTTLLVAFGISSGLGMGLIYSAAIVTVNLSFVRYRPLATGTVLAAGGVGIMVMPLLCRYLLSRYSWWESTCIFAGLTAQLVVAGALLFPPYEEGSSWSCGSCFSLCQNKKTTTSTVTTTTSTSVTTATGQQHGQYNGQKDCSFQHDDRKECKCCTQLSDKNERSFQNAQNPQNARAQSVQNAQNVQTDSNRCVSVEPIVSPTCEHERQRDCQCNSELTENYLETGELTLHSTIPIYIGMQHGRSARDVSGEMRTFSAAAPQNASTEMSSSSQELTYPRHRSGSYTVTRPAPRHDVSIRVSGDDDKPKESENEQDALLNPFSKTRRTQPNGSRITLAQQLAAVTVLSNSTLSLRSLHEHMRTAAERQSQRSLLRSRDHGTDDVTSSRDQGVVDKLTQSRDHKDFHDVATSRGQGFHDVTMPSRDAGGRVLGTCSKVFGNPSLILLCLQLFLQNAAIGILLVHFPTFSIQHGGTFEDVSLAFSVNGLTITLSRFMLGALAQDRDMDPLMLFLGLGQMTTLLLMLMSTVAVTSDLQIMMMAFMGIFSGGSYSLITEITIHCAGVDTLSLAFGMEMICAGLGYLVAPPIAGWLVILTNSYGNAILLSGVLHFIANVVTMVIAVTRPKWEAKGQGHENEEEMEVKVGSPTEELQTLQCKDNDHPTL